MKKQLRYTLAAGLLAAVLCVTPFVAAQTTSGNSVSSSPPATTAPNNSTPDLNAIKLRIQQQKTLLKIKLTKLEEQHIALKCVSAQARVKALTARVNNHATVRTQVYDDIVNALSKLITQLQGVNGIDTSTLTQEQTNLTASVATYKAALADYQQSLSDLQNMDCKSDPVGFQAALQTARTKQSTISTAVRSIRTYITNTIKPTLTQIRTQLNANKTASTTSEGN